jgi:hypothetical protein
MAEDGWLAPVPLCSAAPKEEEEKKDRCGNRSCTKDYDKWRNVHGVLLFLNHRS